MDNLTSKQVFDYLDRPPQRYAHQFQKSSGSREMVEDTDGAWVKFEDMDLYMFEGAQLIKQAVDKIEQLEERVQDLLGQLAEKVVAHEPSDATTAVVVTLKEALDDEAVLELDGATPSVVTLRVGDQVGIPVRAAQPTAAMLCEMEPEDESHDLSNGVVCIACWNRLAQHKVRLEREAEDRSKREYVMAQHDATGRYWSGPREDIPRGFSEVPDRAEGGPAQPPPVPPSGGDALFEIAPTKCAECNATTADDCYFSEDPPALCKFKPADETREFRPIESAPKDGTRVALMHESFDVKLYGSYHSVSGWVDRLGFSFDPQPTHWHPLSESAS